MMNPADVVECGEDDGTGKRQKIRNITKPVHTTWHCVYAPNFSLIVDIGRKAASMKVRPREDTPTPQ